MFISRSKERNIYYLLTEKEKRKERKKVDKNISEITLNVHKPKKFRHDCSK